MIITETYMVGNEEFVRTYSDSGRYVVREGVSYEEACDPSSFGRTYTEGDLIATEEEETDDYAEAGRIMMGVSE